MLYDPDLHRRLLGKARPRFPRYAEAVEASLGARKTKSLTTGLVELREAIDDVLFKTAATEART